MKDFSDIVRSFGMANLMAEVALSKIEKKFDLDLGRKLKVDDPLRELNIDFEAEVIREASIMARHYELFYCLEVSIRKIISRRLLETYGIDWWNSKKADAKDIIPQTVKEYANKNRENELNLAITSRSENSIDYISFGHLADIIVNNWDIFGDMFTKQEAVQRVLKLLNTLRGPVAHCSPLADDEVVKLYLTVRNWFNIMS